EGLAAVAQALALIGPGRPAGADSAPAVATPVASVPDPARVTVALRAVRYEIPGRSAPVLDDADLAIAPGETVDVVGPNGAGKSTAAALLLGFASPSRGSVTVGEQDLCDLDPRAWRKHVTYLPEHPALLGRTLAENLRLADPDASDDELVAALSAAGAPELEADLPDGLDTRLGDGGRPVSSGELQRIALARAFLHRGSLYVLDEPTVHLDAASEEAVVAGLRRLLAGRSAFVVTHRPAVVDLADRVVTLRAGRFVPAGDPSGTPSGAPGAEPAGVGGTSGAVVPS
ncbi:MAG: ATP-binding cassette domain-containing protein, partial [Acidimicrobiales bacterium]